MDKFKGVLRILSHNSLAILLVLGFLFSTATSPVQAALASGQAELPSGFIEERILSGLIQPTAFEFAPDGRLFVAEKSGRIRIVKGDTLLSLPFASVEVNEFSERGLVGLALDPNFSQNGFVYVYYARAQEPIKNRISRFTVDHHNPDQSTGAETVLLDNIPSDSGRHIGGAIHFGTDGKLYVGVGDNGDTGTAQNLGTLSGKVLRINSDGSIPLDNPFVGQSGKRGEIWAYGFRNPFTFAVEPGTGKMYINDVGEGAWEEINNLVKGGNYGWPTCEGTCAQAGLINPIYSYGHTVGNAITGGTFYRDNQFPSEYTGDYFFADYTSDWIKRLDATTGQVSDFAQGATSPVNLTVGPDGSLYYLSIGNGEIYAISFDSTPPTPTSTPGGVCELTEALWSTQEAREGDPVQLTVNSTGDCTGKELSFLVLENDGIFGTDPAHNPPNARFVGNTATTTWTAERQVDGGGLGGDPEYFYIAEVVNGDVSVTSDEPDLKVLPRVVVSPTPTPTTVVQPTATPVGPTNTPTPTINSSEPCRLTSALWSTLQVTDGTPVNLTVTASGNCLDKIVHFEIFENDGIFGSDPINNVPPEATVVNGSATTTWTAERQVDGAGGIGGDPEYFFIAEIVDGDESITTDEPDLKVIARTGGTPTPTPTSHPTVTPTAGPTPTAVPTQVPTVAPTTLPTVQPTPTTPVVPTPSVDIRNGLIGVYYDNDDFTGYSITRIDPQVAFDWKTGRPEPTIGGDSFAVRWTGYMVPNTSELYTIYTKSDDGVKLWINNKLVVNNFTYHLLAEDWVTMPLVAGEKYQIRLEYFEGGNNATIELGWSSPSVAKGPIPSANLFSAVQSTPGGPTPGSGNPTPTVQPTAAPTAGASPTGTQPVPTSAPTSAPTPTPMLGNGLQAIYFDNEDFTGHSVSRIEPQVNFEWEMESPDPSISRDSFSARWTGALIPATTETYTIYTRSDDGVKLWFDNKLVVNNWTYHQLAENGFTVQLEAGKPYPIRMDYFEGGNLATAQLWWSSPTIQKGAIPTRNLSPQLPATVTPTPTQSIPTVAPTQVPTAVPTPLPTGTGGSVTPTPAPTIQSTPTPTGSSTGPCELIEATWSTLQVTEGNPVTLRVTGSGSCNGKEVAFQVLENDGMFGSDPATNPANTHFVGNVATTTWIAERQVDGAGGLGGDPEYFFIAEIVDEDMSITTDEPDLKVVARTGGTPTPTPTPTPTGTPTTTGSNGLIGVYFDNENYTGEFEVRVDPTINFEWGLSSPYPGIIAPDTFAVRWTGYIVPPTNGTYTLYTKSDDGVKLTFNNTLAINNWTNHALAEDQVTVQLEGGKKYPIKLEYFEGGNTATIQLYWSSASIPKQIIPNSQLLIQ